MKELEDPADFDRMVYSKYLNGVSIEDITHWVNWFSMWSDVPNCGDASPNDINDIIDQMNEIFN